MKQLLRGLTIAAQVLLITLLTGLYTTRSINAHGYNDGSGQRIESASEEGQHRNNGETGSLSAEATERQGFSNGVYVGIYGGTAYGLGTPFVKRGLLWTEKLSPQGLFGITVDVSISDRMLVGMELSTGRYDVIENPYFAPPFYGLVLSKDYIETMALFNVSIRLYRRGIWRNVQTIAGIGMWTLSDYGHSGIGASLGLVASATLDSKFEVFLMPRFRYVILDGTDLKMIHVAAGIKLIFRGS